MPRRLGQHFLQAAWVEKLLRVIDPRPDETFLEIGPGAGALTVPLAARCARVRAVEIDAALAGRLRARGLPNLYVVHADALAADLHALAPPGTRLAGNLPYYISSPLLRRFLDLREHLTDAHLLLQEEVARRVASPPGSREYGILSVLYGLWAETAIALRVPPGAFSPPPRVSSALLRVRFRERPAAEVGDPAGFQRLLEAAFARRRRTLENNLQDSYLNLKEHLRLLHIEGSRRAETLSVAEFAALSRTLVPVAEARKKK
jgi:16S rRNA (adenine1518-N6/adenine1519-N6)-dimethyltransferase